MRKPVRRGNVLRSLVLHNGTIIVNVRTAPRMRVRISVTLTHTTYVETHRGRHRRRVARAVVLYATTVRTKANNTGCITESMRLAYTPPKPIRAVLMVMVHSKQGTTIRRIGLTIQPPRHHPRPACHPSAYYHTCRSDADTAERVTLSPQRRERRRSLMTGPHTRTGTGY
jgi:hypothetical protein